MVLIVILVILSVLSSIPALIRYLKILTVTEYLMIRKRYIRIYQRKSQRKKQNLMLLKKSKLKVILLTGSILF